MLSAWHLLGLIMVQSPQSDTTRFRVAFALNDATAPAAQFGLLSGLAIDTQGTLYVSDLSQHHVLAFDRQGHFRGTIGREGQGPGEFNAPSGLVFDRASRLYVRDLTHVHRFVWDPQVHLVARYDSAFTGPLYPNWMSGRASRIDSAGRYYYPSTTMPHGGTPWHQFYRYSTSGKLLDSLRIPSLATEPPGAIYIQTPPPCCKTFAGLTHVPFAPLPVWDVLPDGRLVSGDGASYHLQIAGFGNQSPIDIFRSVKLDRIPATERAESLAALRRRLDSLPVSPARVPLLPRSVAALQLPQTFPAYDAVVASQEGLIWVRRWTAGRASPTTIFDVFDNTGRFRTTVLLPVRARTEPTPLLSLRRVVVTVEDPETGEIGVTSLVPVH